MLNSPANNWLVQKLERGDFTQLGLFQRFGYKTGKEAFRAIRTFIRLRKVDPQKKGKFRIVTAYPTNELPREKKLKKRSETFREFGVFLQADPGFSFEEGEEMLHMAGRQMTKNDRRQMNVPLKDVEAGKITYQDIQSFWNGSGARFYIVGEDAVRSFLYRARLVLEQSFFLLDVEDVKTSTPFKKRETRTQLFPAEHRAIQRLADLVYDIHLLDPYFNKDRRKLVLERLIAEDKDGVMKLPAAIARSEITDELLQAAWQKNVAADLVYMRGNIVSSIYGVAQLIDERR
ncbi:hypothetical protein LJR255_003754 [Pararhizobium sp. LjRoot255]|uniref:hypothetical protein n=1 Tax=Pararhizobium sp. LjRoot255 TaxID=3342298 RepID=UPI003ECCC3DA